MARAKKIVEPPIPEGLANETERVDALLASARAAERSGDPDEEGISLRQAVIQANHLSANVTIFLDAGTYSLTRQGANEDAGFTGDGPREQRLTGAGRAVEEEALGGADPEAGERVPVPERQLDAFPERPLRLLQPADVAPADVGHLDHDLAQRRRLDALERVHEVAARDPQLLEHRGGQLARLQGPDRHP
jgi:hypothetical protein